jgi:hypothetical protein
LSGLKGTLLPAHTAAKAAATAWILFALLPAPSRSQGATMSCEAAASPAAVAVESTASVAMYPNDPNWPFTPRSSPEIAVRWATRAARAVASVIGNGTTTCGIGRAMRPARVAARSLLTAVLT